MTSACARLAVYLLTMLLAAVALTDAARASPLDGLTLSSDGHLGDISSLLFDQRAWYLNTDDGNLYSNGGFGIQLTTTLTTVVVTPSIGPQVREWDFANFNLAATQQLTIIGSLAAAIVVHGDASVNGQLLVTDNAQPGGNGGACAGNGNGGCSGGGGAQAGQAGQGGQGLRFNPPCCFSEVTAGGGGGGGHISAGQDGQNGQFVTGAQSLGGAGGQPITPAARNLLQGGAGGGGGGGDLAGGFEPGGHGGAGGGALLLVTAGSFTLGSTGAIHADGVSPGDSGNTGNGGGGGGAGGTLWFDVADHFLNDGLISAVGGAGGINEHLPHEFSNGGAGSGGVVYIDPLDITNNGIIDVADGTGSGDLGGRVDLISAVIDNNGQIEGEAPLIDAIPEPTAAWLLALPMLALLRRRR